MARHIRSMDIQTFRGIRGLKINNLGDINILVGNNNSGKTSVLEAIKLLQYPEDIGSICRVAFSRIPKVTSSSMVEFFSSMFLKGSIDNDSPNLLNYNSKADYYIKVGANVKDDNINMEIVGEIYDKLRISNDDSDDEVSILNDEEIIQKKFLGSIKLSSDSNRTQYIPFEIGEKIDKEVSLGRELYNCIFIHTSISIYSSCVKYLSEAIINDKKDDLLKLLMIFDSSITDITSIESTIWIHSRIKNTMPLFSYGTGMQKALLLAAILVQLKDGVVLIDEVDNAIHISALGDVFTWLIKACKKMNIQAFMTTHSLEALDTMLEISNQMNDSNSIKVITLKKENGQTLSRVLTGVEAYKSRNEFNLELR